MATPDQIREAISCLSTVYPQFVQKELATLTDQIQATVQGFTDPLAALGDLNIDSLIESAAQIDVDNPQDAFTNLSKAAIGLTSQYIRREVTEMQESRTLESAATKRIQEVQALGDKVVQTVITTLGIFPDIPYAAAQRICSLIDGLAEIKVENLECLQKHVTQLLNAVLVLVDQASFKDDTLEDLGIAKDLVKSAYNELLTATITVNGQIGFDQEAFSRARENLINASRTLAPPTGSTTILDLVEILETDSAGQGYADRTNAALVYLVIPSLINLIEQEVSAYVGHVSSLNFFVEQLTTIIENYRGAVNTSSVATQRARVIANIQQRLLVMCSAMEVAIQRGDIKAASGQMLLWTSRIRSVISSMDEVGKLTLQEGSLEGDDRALALANALSDLILTLTSINSDKVVAGIEDATQLRDQTNSLATMAGNVVNSLSQGTLSQGQLATLHALGVQVGNDQLGFIAGSISLARQQQAACAEFLTIELDVADRFDVLLDSMRQVGFDRGVDLLGSGQFQDFLDSGLERLSYTGAAVNCLSDALNGIDDVQTRRRIISIRDDLIGKRNNIELAAADSGDQGLTRFLDRIETDIADIQRNAKLVESIVDDLSGILERIGEAQEESFGAITDFISSVDRLAVDAGGRLAEVLEERSAFANAGVVRCE